MTADGTTRRVFLTSLTLQGEVVHRVVARRIEAAWLTARIENTESFALLAGPVSSYLGTAYVGDGQLPLTAPGSEVDLSFGVDDRVQIKREALADVEEGHPRARATKERQHYRFETTVENHTGKSITVVLADQVPASNQADWEVKTTTTPETEVPKTGVFEWEVEMKAGEEKEFLLEYEGGVAPGDAVPVLLD